jgi:hypothetical protein
MYLRSEDDAAEEGTSRPRKLHYEGRSLLEKAPPDLDVIHPGGIRESQKFGIWSLFNS